MRRRHLAANKVSLNSLGAIDLEMYGRIPGRIEEKLSNGGFYVGFNLIDKLVCAFYQFPSPCPREGKFVI